MRVLSSKEYVTAQYHHASNFDARVRLYELYATNPLPWMIWLFECMSLSEGEIILELGSGTGSVWRTNWKRLPKRIRLILSDTSRGMLDKTRRNLMGLERQPDYLQADAQTIPFVDESCDVVLANHMLYHVPDRRRAITESLRVLKPGGRFYVGTNHWTHLQELRELVHRFGVESSLLPPGRDATFFDLENAAEEIAQYFSHLRLFRREDTLEITEVEPLLDYIRSCFLNQRDASNSLDVLRKLRQHVVRQISLLGALHISVSTGVLEATKSYNK